MRERKFIKQSMVFLLTIILTANFMVKSYATTNDLSFDNLDIEKGISQSTIEVVFQDHKGYIWLGTNDGLNRYNGYEYKIYNYEENKNSMSSNGITDICEDDKNNLWVGTVQGVNRIDEKREEIKNYTEENNKIKDDSTSEILITQDNKIIVGTYEGIQLYNEEKDTFENILNVDKGLISNTVYTLDEDKQGNIWIGTDLGVQQISKDFKILKTYKSDGQNSLGESEIYNIYCDEKYGYVWAGSSDSGVFKIDTNLNTITQYKNDPKDENSLPANQSGAILRDSNDNLWIGTSDGLAWYNSEKDNFKVYKNKIYDKNSLVYNNVKSLMEDKEGIIWVGTYSGLSIFDTKSVIKHYKAGLDEDYLLSENMVHGIYEDKDGYLWVGSKTKGVSIIDRKNQTSKTINTTNNQIIKTDTINDITGYKDLIFIATDDGLVKIDKKLNTMKVYTTENNMVNDAVKDIMVDDKGYLWIGTISGLSILNIEKDEMIDVSKYISKDSYVKHIYQDLEGNYYLGLLKDEGLCYINVKQRKIKYFKNDKKDKTSISSNRIRYINGDSKDNIWIGTSYGVNKFDKKTETFERYTAKDGIANNTIYGLLVDDKDDIWISTNRGISKINQKNNKIQSLSVTDGLQSNEFNGNASFKSNSGELFFGGINGLNAFYPQEIDKMASDTKVLFDTFYINNKEYKNLDNKKLSKDSNSITIKFFAPIYSHNKNLLYEYKLEGGSGDVFTTKLNYVTYNELPAGKYTFKVRVIDSSGNKSEESKVSFVIKPPFWRSPLAIIIYLIIAALIIMRAKHKVKVLDKKVNERTRELQEEMIKSKNLHKENIRLERSKNNYFINISHELRTPLNVVNATNQLIKSSIEKDLKLDKEKLNYYVDVCQRNCNRLLNLINNILDNSKLQNNMYEIILRDTDIIYLVEETALTMIDYVNSKGIELIIDPEVEEKTVKCDAVEIERCIINLISNAIKYTPEGGSITVGIEDLGDKVKINVQDTGCGIDEEFHESIFDRFNQVLDDEVIKGGSGLGLTITKQIIKLHKGDIYVESKVGEGSNFVIILPTNL